MSEDKVLLEAESLVNKWIKHSYEDMRSEDPEPARTPTTSNKMDDVITLAFHKADQGNVSDAVEDILNGLRELPIENEVLERMERRLNPKDPRIAMEQRQRKLVEKRRERQERQKIRQEKERKEQQLLAERRDSKKDVKVEYHKQRIAAAVLSHQVNSFREEVRREALNRRDELTSLYSAKLSTAPLKSHPPRPPVREDTTPDTDRDGGGAERAIREAETVVQEQIQVTESLPIIEEAEELVSARETAIKLSHSRRVLIGQLEEASKLEVREDLQLIHRVFGSWHSLTADNRISLAKARTVGEWKTLCRMFSAWKGAVGRSRETRERGQLAECMLQEKQGDSIAWGHFSGKLVRKCFACWRIWARNTGELRRHADRIREKRIKMAIFLEAAEKGKITHDRNAPRDRQKKKSHPLDMPIRVGDLFEERIGVVTSKMVREKIRTIPEKQKKRKLIKEKSEDSTKTKEEKIEKSNSTPIVIMETAKECTDPVPKSISIIIPDTGQRDAAPLYVPPDPPAPPSHPKRFTTPIPLTQMEERSAAILQRKREREERTRALEEERASKEREASERRAEEEEEARRDALLKRQSEKRAEKQREIEKVMAREKLAMQSRKATAHYERSLLKKYCLGGLVRFRRIQERKGGRADEFRRVRAQREYFPLWIQAMERRERIKMENAEKHLKESRMKIAFRHWLAYVSHYNELYQLADDQCNVKVARKCLKAWKRFNGNEVCVYLRRCLLADMFFDRILVRRGFRSMRAFIPLMEEERQREIRMEALRDQVRQFIPDFGQNWDA